VGKTILHVGQQSAAVLMDLSEQTEQWIGILHGDLK